MTKRQEQAQATKQAILDAALNLANKKDVDNISIKDISETCGIAIGTIYYYFPSKDAIFTHLALHRGTAAVDELSNETIQEYIDRLNSYITMRIKAFTKESSQFRRNMNRYKMTDLYTQERSHQTADDYELNHIKQYFNNGIKSGYFKADFPVNYFSYQILYIIYGIEFQISLYNRKPDIINWTDQYVAHLNEAIHPYIQSKNRRVHKKK